MNEKNTQENQPPEEPKGSEQISSVRRSERLRRFSLLGKILYYLGMVEMDDEKLRKWHPLSWVVICMMVLLLPIICMFTDSTAKELLTGLKDW